MQDKGSINNRLFKQAYEDYHEIIYKYCYSRLGEYHDFAEDCMQNAFIVYYQKLCSGKHILSPKAYLYRVAENIVKKTKAQQTKRNSKIIPLEEAYEISAPEIDIAAAELDYDEIKEILISGLSVAEQLLYEQKYVRGMSLQEIADFYGIEPMAAANRTSRLRKKIIKQISPVLEKYTEGEQK